MGSDLANWPFSTTGGFPHRFYSFPSQLTHEFRNTRKEARRLFVPDRWPLSRRFLLYIFLVEDKNLLESMQFILSLFILPF